MGNNHFIKHSFLLIVYNNFLFDVVKYMLLKEMHLTTEEAAHLYRVQYKRTYHCIVVVCAIGTQ
jgi:hypothetical protein